MPENSHPRLVISLVLACDLVIAWLITGDWGYAILALPMIGLGAFLRGRGVLIGSILAGIVICLGGRWISEQLQIVGELMPRLFDFGIAAHLGIWIWAKNARLGWVSIFGSAMVIASIDSLEIYYANPFLVRVLAFIGLATSVAWALRVRSGYRSAIAACAFGILATLCLSPANQAAEILRERFGGTTKRSTLETENPTPYAANVGPSTANGRELPRRANLALNDHLRLFLQIESASDFRRVSKRPLYVRTQVASAFRDIEQLRPVRRSEWRYDSDDGQVDGWVDLGGRSSGFESTVFLNQADAYALPIPAGASAVAMGSVYEFAEDWYQYAFEEEQTQVKYRVRANPVHFRDLLASEVILPAEIDPVYLELPESTVVDRLKMGARGAKRAPVSDLLSDTRDWVQSRADYSLEYENPEDLPALQNFLFSERLGHCELFAAATVLKLRLEGVPARMAWGYCGGVSVPAQRLIAYRESDFHAWAEVPIEGRGWVIFDTTPPGEGAMHVADTGGSTGSVNLGSYQDIGGEFDAERIAQVSSWSDIFARSVTWVSDRFFWIVLGFVILAVFARRKHGAVLDAPRLKVGPRRRSGEDLADEFVRLFAEKGIHRRPGETLGEFVTSLKKGGHCADEFDPLIAYLYGVRYEERATDPARERDFLRQIRSDHKRAATAGLSG